MNVRDPLRSARRNRKRVETSVRTDYVADWHGQNLSRRIFIVEESSRAIHRWRRSPHGRSRLIEGLDNPELDELYPMEMPYVRESIELVQGATDPFDLRKFLAGDQSPVLLRLWCEQFWC